MKTILKLLPVLALSLMLTLQINAQQTNDYLKFKIKDLVSRQKHKSESAFLSENTLTGKLLYIGKTEKRNVVSEVDQVYYIIDGKGKLKIGNMDVALNKGSIVFVPRNSFHSFHDVEVSIHAVELASLANKGMADSLAVGFSLDQIEKARQPNDNVWNDFLKRKSMIFGLYMLPKSLNGDKALTHKWDEVNLITKGSGKFQVGEKIMDVEPGDIIYVKKGNAHFFHSLKGDLDILIFFEMKSIQSQ